MGSIGLRVFLVVAFMGMGGLSFAEKAVGPGGITTNMSVEEAGHKAYKMSSKEIGEAIVFLKSKLGSSKGSEKANIEKLIQELEKRKSTQEHREKKKKRTQAALDNLKF